MRLKGGAQVKEEEVSVGKAVVSEEMERGVAQKTGRWEKEGKRGL